MEPTPDPRKKPHDDGGWWIWFTSLFSSNDSAPAHTSGGETMSEHGAHHGGDAGHDGGGGGDAGGDAGGGDGGGGGD